MWNSKRLKDVLKQNFSGEDIIVISNRQPYSHNKNGRNIEIQSPASGLVTAVEPILRACSGVWLAHGSGSADREVVDSRDRIKVPPEDPQYEIHRLWLTAEEEQGFYYGFANEGLWPLCHIAHVRPIFRREDWEFYVKVNQKFAEAAIADAKTDEPVIFVHDYHLALVPRLLRIKLPKAIIITFWHIPWPNAESFGICPWRESILDGLIASSILGFQTQFHCNNFLATVDRFLECRIDHESDAIVFHGHYTDVRAYPISIAYPPHGIDGTLLPSDCKKIVREQEEIAPTVKIGIGIDRLDYTKGIIERVRSIENLFTLYLSWVGKFTFIQVAAPSRSNIKAYQNFRNDVFEIIAEINHRYGHKGYVPIILKAWHHSPHEVYRLLRASDVCIVSSLHDGMNLVAKEFIASRSDESGVLILSMFTGAAFELTEALIINPYDTDQVTLALKAALEMSSFEQRERMRALRSYLEEYNVYRWAGRMLLDAARLKKQTSFAKRLKRFKASMQAKK